MKTLFSIIGCLVFIGALVFAGLYLYVEFMDWRLRQYCLKHLVFKEAKSVKTDNTDDG
jgi:hypothetical protein